MKVHLLPDGTVELEVGSGDGQAALDFIDAMQARHRDSQKLRAEIEASRAAETVNLSALLYRTWEFLVENDRPEGVHISAVARAFGCPDTAASARMKELLKQGNAKRVRRGYYRAIDGGIGGQQ